MLTLTKEQFRELGKYERHLCRGYKGNYTFGVLQSEFNALYDIYQKAGGNESLKYSCGSCVLRLTKTLGEAYYKYEEANAVTIKKPKKKKEE